MEKTPAARFRPTRIACYLGYITQSIAINLLSLLYVTLQRDYGISLEQISLLITVCFVVQIAVDLIAARSGERLSYRFGTVAANAAVAAGLVALGILPRVMPVPYVGVVIAVVLMAIGGGLTEVLISPLIDRLPSAAARASRPTWSTPGRPCRNVRKAESERVTSSYGGSGPAIGRAYADGASGSSTWVMPIIVL